MPYGLQTQIQFEFQTSKLINYITFLNKCSQKWAFSLKEKEGDRENKLFPLGDQNMMWKTRK